MNKDGSPLRAGGDSAHRLPPPLQVLRLILWATSKMLSSACHYTGQGKVAAPTQGPTSARALFPIHPFIIKYSSSTLCPRGCTPITFFKECKYLKKSVFFFPLNFCNAFLSALARAPERATQVEASAAQGTCLEGCVQELFPALALDERLEDGIAPRHKEERG